MYVYISGTYLVKSKNIINTKNKSVKSDKTKKKRKSPM